LSNTTRNHCQIRQETIAENGNVLLVVKESIKERVKKEDSGQGAYSPLSKPKELQPQQRLYEYFAELYKKHVGAPYIAAKKDFIIFANLLKECSEDLIKSRIDYFCSLCQKGDSKNNKYFAKEGFASFTIGAFKSHFNELANSENQDIQRKMEREIQEMRCHVGVDYINEDGSKGSGSLNFSQEYYSEALEAAEKREKEIRDKYKNGT
jgi:hypothetical protein